MKKQKKYTLMFVSNTASSLKRVSISQKDIYMGIFISSFLVISLLVFLTDYFQMNVDQWKLTSLKTENQKLEKKLAGVEKSFKELETKVQQMTDLSRKLKLITTFSPKHKNSSHTGYGKVSLDSQILNLSQPARNLSHEDHIKDKPPMLTDSKNNNIEIRIEKLKETNQLVKQDFWQIYSDLLEKQEFMNNTPSILPARGWISSTYGYRNETVFVDHQPQFHKGLDIATARGEPVISTADGKVVYVGYDESGYGNLLIIDHGYNLKTYYAHLSTIKVKIGDTVNRGEEVASVGNTGKSTGPHLHYEVRIFGQSVDPEHYILNDLH